LDVMSLARAIDMERTFSRLSWVPAF